MSALTGKLVDRYVFRQLLDYFLLGVVVFTLIAFFSDTLLKFIREVQKYGIPFGTLLTMIGLQLPRSVALVIPAASFLAVLMVFNQLNNHFEIIAMRMNGISLWRLMIPAVVLGIFCSVLTYVLNDYVVPWCNARTDQMKDQVMRSGSLPSGGTSFMYRTYDENHNLQQMIYVSQYSGHQLGDSTIIDLSKKSVMQVIQARSGVWDPQKGWEMNNANVYLVGRDAEHSSAGHAESFLVQGLLKNGESEEKQREDLDRDRKGINCNSDQMNFGELYGCIKRRELVSSQGEARGVARNTYLSLWSKITWPLGCLALIISAVPLSMAPPRQGSNRGFVFAIIILFLLYELYSVFQSLGKVFYPSIGLSLPAWLALVSWTPLALMILLGVVLIQRKSRVL